MSGFVYNRSKKEGEEIMFSKTKMLLCAVALVGLVGCSGSGDEFEQNNSHYVAPEETMYIIGSHWNDWTPDTIKDADPSCKFLRQGETNIYYYDFEVTDEMATEGPMFKFIAGPSWDIQYGMEDVDLDACNAAFKALFPGKTKEDWSEEKNRSNINLTGDCVGSYHIVYNPYDLRTDDGGRGFKFVINFTPAAE